MTRDLLSRRFGLRTIAVGLVLFVSACGTAEPTASTAGGSASASTTTSQDTTTTSSTAASTEPESPGDDGFCAAVDGIAEDLSVTDLDADWDADPQEYVARLAAAAERFSTVTPPDDIAEYWEALGDFFSMADAALEGVDPTDPDAVRAALRFEGEDAFAMVIQMPGQAETVGAFVQSECGVDLGITPPVVANVCAALDPAHLESVFDGTVPPGGHRPWGSGVVECVWGDDDAEVGIVVGPAALVVPDVLQGLEPIDEVQLDGPTIQVYDGALGPLRAASGRTAATEVGDTAVVASVRTGDTDADALKAIALVGLVAADLVP